MKYLKVMGFVAVVAAALMAFAGIASATELTSPKGTKYSGGITAAAEGTTTLHPPIGDIECSGSGVEGTITNAGGSTSTVSGPITKEKLTFTGCNATVKVLAEGSLEIHTKTASADGNGLLTGSGNEVTVEFAGFHCIFKTSGTTLGTVTGSSNTGGNATLDIEATIPRTGGRSGAFCGSTAQWTGSYKVSSPSFLDVD